MNDDKVETGLKYRYCLDCKTYLGIASVTGLCHNCRAKREQRTKLNISGKFDKKLRDYV